MSTGIHLFRPTGHEQAHRASEAGQALREGRRVFVGNVGGRKSVELPDEVVDLLVNILGHLAQGNGVTVAPLQADLTTQQAADLLGVSRPFLVQLIESGAMPFHRVGTHRRIGLADLLAYKEQQEARSRAVLTELSEQAQDLSLGY